MAAVARFRRNRRLPAPRLFRDRLHPLDKFDDDEIYGKFRFRRHQIIELTDEVSEQLELCNRTGGLPPILQLLLALRFYACGTFQDVCGELVGVHQSTASRTISRVTKALLTHVHNWIKFPTQAEADQNKRTFYQKYGFPNVVGCIDGTQIRIQSPSQNECDFVNRKNVHSINVQVSTVSTSFGQRW